MTDLTLDHRQFLAALTALTAPPVEVEAADAIRPPPSLAMPPQPEQPKLLPQAFPAAPNGLLARRIAEEFVVTRLGVPEQSIIVWDLETVPDLAAAARMLNLGCSGGRGSAGSRARLPQAPAA